MWIILGLSAMVMTCINLYLGFRKKRYQLATAVALSLTALTMCANHTLITKWVLAEDWGALIDTVPPLDGVWWFLVLVSMGLNMIPIFIEFTLKPRSNEVSE